MNISEFREKYVKRSPRPRTREYEPEEFEQWQDADGVSMLPQAPVQCVKLGKPPPTGIKEGDNTYLWVIDGDGIKIVLEQPTEGRPVPKHSNLTGGGEAYVGGQLWFSGEASIYLSGGSGRYPPRNELELEDAVMVFESLGYAVTSLGWDGQAGSAFRHYDED